MQTHTHVILCVSFILSTQSIEKTLGPCVTMKHNKYGIHTVLLCVFYQKPVLLCVGMYVQAVFFFFLDLTRSSQKQMWELETNSMWARPILRHHSTIRCFTWTWVSLITLWKHTLMFLDSLQKKSAVQTPIFVIQNNSMDSVTFVKPH